MKGTIGLSVGTLLGMAQLALPLTGKKITHSVHWFFGITLAKIRTFS